MGSKKGRAEEICRQAGRSGECLESREWDQPAVYKLVGGQLACGENRREEDVGQVKTRAMQQAGR